MTYWITCEYCQYTNITTLSDGFCDGCGGRYSVETDSAPCGVADEDDDPYRLTDSELGAVAADETGLLGQEVLIGNWEDLRLLPDERVLWADYSSFHCAVISSARFIDFELLDDSGYGRVTSWCGWAAVESCVIESADGPCDILLTTSSGTSPYRLLFDPDVSHLERVICSLGVPVSSVRLEVGKGRKRRRWS